MTQAQGMTSLYACEMGFAGEMAFRDCPWCGLRDAQMSVLTQRLQSTPQVQGGPGKPRTFAVLACPRCGSPIVVETNPHNESPGKEISVFPETEHRTSIAHVPDEVMKEFVDAQRALDAQLHSSAAVSLRKCLEGAALQFEIEDRTLAKRIEQLAEKGLVTEAFKSAAHITRGVGNAGAHFGQGDEVEELEVRRAMKFTEQLLRSLFEIPGEVNALAVNDDG